MVLCGSYCKIEYLQIKGQLAEEGDFDKWALFSMYKGGGDCWVTCFFECSMMWGKYGQGVLTAMHRHGRDNLISAISGVGCP